LINCGFCRLIDLARAEPVAEFERLKALDETVAAPARAN
jgi:hypothetical protein